MPSRHASDHRLPRQQGNCCQAREHLRLKKTAGLAVGEHWIGWQSQSDRVGVLSRGAWQDPKHSKGSLSVSQFGNRFLQEPSDDLFGVDTLGLSCKRGDQPVRQHRGGYSLHVLQPNHITARERSPRLST